MNVASGTWVDAYTKNMATSQKTAGERNYRNIIPATGKSGSKIRITVEAGSDGNWVLDGCSIGVMTTDDVYSSTPTRITFDGGSYGATVTNSGTKVSDEVTFSFSSTVRYGVHIYSADRTNITYTNSGAGMYWDSAGDDTMVLDASLDSSELNYGLVKIEVYQ